MTAAEFIAQWGPGGPAWLAQAHEALDTAVAAAYGWPDYTPAMPDDDILRRLPALNRQRAPAPEI
jgi:hypothetical protein